jgi:tetratricopeptide (TPR) repeat protein
VKRRRRTPTAAAPARRAPAPTPAAGPPAPPRVGKRRWTRRAALAAFAVVALAGMLEAGLRALGYGYPTRFFVPQPDGKGYTTNPRFPWLFADRTAATPPPAALPAEKAPGTYRVFILGESAAAGMPDPAYGFGRVLEVMLRERHPDARFEVITAAVPGLNSRAVLTIAEDCARHQPDLFVLYMGNNEVMGPYGPGAAARPFAASRALVRAGLWARSLRAGQLVASWAARPADVPAPPPGAEAFAGTAVGPDDPRRSAVGAHFRANLADIIAAGRGAGARVVACTVGTNLKDCPPFAAANRPDLAGADKARWQAHYDEGVVLERDGRPAEAAEKYRAAARIDDRHAELHFRLARCLLGFRQYDDARRHFALARDCDALPFRADARLNEAVRQVAGGREADGVHLADVERALEQAAEGGHGLPGRDLFWDHAHLRPAGSHAVARAVLPHVEAALGLGLPDTAAVLSAERCAELLAETAYDRQRCAVAMLQATARPPFTGQLGHAQRFEAEAKAAADLAAADPEWSRGMQWYTAALARRPDDWVLHNNFAAYLLAAGRPAEAADHVAAVVQALPGDLPARLRLADVLAASGRAQEAVDLCQQAVAAEPASAPARLKLGDLLARQRRMDDALAAYEAVLRLRPGDADALTRRGLVRLDQGDTAAARADFEAALKSGPDPETDNALGSLLIKQDKLAEALPHFQRACLLRPADPRFQNNCGTALLSLGRADEAADHFRAAAERDQKYCKAHATLARVAAARGRSAEADEHLRRAAQRENDRPGDLDGLARTVTNYATALLTKGDVVAAKAGFEGALELSPDAEAALQLGTLLLKEGKAADALAQLQRASLLRPGDARLQNNCGMALLALGRTDEAADRFRAAVELNPKHAKAHASLGQILMARGDLAGAIGHYRTAVGLTGDQPSTLSALAWLLATTPDPRLRDGPRAVALAEQACRLTGGRDHTCLDALSAAYAEVGRFDEAVRAARQAASAADAAGAAEQAAVIRRRLPILEAHRPLHP